MTPVERCEHAMRHREADWWDLLCDVIPELSALAGTPQPAEYHAEGDVAVHTRLAVEACADPCDADLLWVALLHDIGKPKTTLTRPDGRITAHGHAALGTRLADEILTRLGMSEPRKKRITWVIRHHMFHHSWQLQSPDELSKKQRRTLLEPDFPLLLEFLRIDTLASQGKTARMATYEFYRKLYRQVTETG